MIRFTHISIQLEKIIVCRWMFKFTTYLWYCINGCKYLPSKIHHVLCNRRVSQSFVVDRQPIAGEGDVSCSTMVNKGMFCPSFDIKYTWFWTIVIQRKTPPQKCCHTTDGLSPVSLWMFAVSTAVCYVQCCCSIPTFTSSHFGLTVNMHVAGGHDGRVLVYRFWPKAKIWTYLPTITWHVQHWHKIV
jgi:hypothetical protein